MRGKAEQLSMSRMKILTTTCKPFSLSLYVYINVRPLFFE